MIYDRNTVKTWAGDSQWRALRADYARFQDHGHVAWGAESFWALAVYRCQRMAQKLKPGLLRLPLVLGLKICKKLVTLATTVDLHPRANIGPGFYMPHGGQIRIREGTTIGADCAVHHVVTIGAGPQDGGAVIGDHVMVSCHSSIIGPVIIGDGAVVAANSLVIYNVPAGATAIGVPAKILPGFKPAATVVPASCAVPMPTPAAVTTMSGQGPVTGPVAAAPSTGGI